MSLTSRSLIFQEISQSCHWPHLSMSFHFEVTQHQFLSEFTFRKWSRQILEVLVGKVPVAQAWEPEFRALVSTRKASCGGMLAGTDTEGSQGRWQVCLAKTASFRCSKRLCSKNKPEGHWRQRLPTSGVSMHIHQQAHPYMHMYRAHSLEKCGHPSGRNCRFSVSPLCVLRMSSKQP